MADKSSSSSSIGFVGLLTIAFIVLKLTHYIDWSWWWITSPLWISGTLAIILISIAAYFDVKTERLREKREKEWNDTHQGKPSKFMQKLDEAMKRSDDARQKLNDN